MYTSKNGGYKQTKLIVQQPDEYEALLDEYEQTIIELQSCMEQSSSPEYQEMMNSAQEYKERLEELAY